MLQGGEEGVLTSIIHPSHEQLLETEVGIEEECARRLGGIKHTRKGKHVEVHVEHLQHQMQGLQGMLHGLLQGQQWPQGSADLE